MSRGVLDQEAFDAATRASEWAARNGKRAFWAAVHHHDDGTRSFRFRFEDLPRRKAAPVDAPAPARRVTRGATQGSLL